MAYEEIDPRTLTQCKSVLLADDATTVDTNGDLVTEWRPVSGYASGTQFTRFVPLNAAFTSSTASVNGLNVLKNTIAGGRGLLPETASATNGQQVTYHMALAIDALPTGTQGLACYQGNSAGRPQHLVSENGYYIQQIGEIPFEQAPIGDFFILSIQHSLTLDTSRAAVNGKVVLTQSAAAGTWGNPLLVLMGNKDGWNTPVCRIGAFVFYEGLTTDEHFFGIAEWLKGRYGITDSPYPGLHEVTNIDNASDPNCIYNGQSPAIKIGDTFSYKQESEINAWPVSIDADGYPIVDSGGESGTDSFLFDIDRGAGFDDPSEWTFTIAGPGVPVPPDYTGKIGYLGRSAGFDASAGWSGVEDGTWSATGLPPDLAIDPGTGWVAGVFTEIGVFDLVVITFTPDADTPVSANPFIWEILKKPAGGRPPGSGRPTGLWIHRPKVHTRDIKRRGWRTGRRGRR